MPRGNGCQPQTYPAELLKRIIWQRYNLKRNIPHICLELNIPKHIIEKTLKQWRDTGEVIPITGRLGKGQQLMLPEEADCLIDLVEENPDLYLDEIQRDMLSEHGLVVGISTIWNTMTELGLTRKKLSNAVAAECTDCASIRFELQIGAESPDRLVFIDESRLDCYTTFKDFRRAHLDQHACICAKCAHGKRYSIHTALSSQGIVYSDVHEGPSDGVAFLRFVKGLLGHMNVWPAPQSVLVMTRSGSDHLNPELENICKEKDVKIYYLPPYLPELNPVEELFSFVKSMLRRPEHAHELLAAVDTNNWNRLNFLLHDTLASITPEMAWGWMHRSRYV